MKHGITLQRNIVLSWCCQLTSEYHQTGNVDAAVMASVSQILTGRVERWNSCTVPLGEPPGPFH